MIHDKPRALDLFCGGGGATKGLQEAGYHVTGVDINPQPHYCGDAFHQTDALTFPLEGYDLIWASPPCQFGSVATPGAHRHKHPNLIGPIRDRLTAQGAPYIIENVEGSRAHLINPVMLCGTMFGLRFWRHRYFEVPALGLVLTPPCRHTGRMVLLTGSHGHGGQAFAPNGPRYDDTLADKKKAVGIDWMTEAEMTQAIPPAYSEYLAMQLLIAGVVAA